MNSPTHERTTSLAGLLREYADKLLQLNRELMEALWQGAKAVNAPGQLAWLLDRSKRLDRPVRDLVNGAANSIELAVGFTDESLETAEITLRLGETEAQLHHMIRQSAELQKLIEEQKATDRVARLRESAGLNGMKGGPLRPNG